MARTGETSRKSLEAYVQHNGPVVGRLKYYTQQVLR